MNDFYQQETPSEKPPKRKFWQNMFTQDSGEIRRVLSLSSLMLSFLLIAVYFLSYLLLMPLIDKVTGNIPVLAATILESLIPAVIATEAVMICWPLFKDKRVLPSAYLWMTLFAAALFVGVLVSLRDDPAARSYFLYIFGWDVLPSLIIGNFAAWRRYFEFIRK